MTLFLICLMQISADSVKESDFYIIASSTLNPGSSGSKQNWRIQSQLFISCVTLDKSLNTSVPQQLICEVRIWMGKH